ncbi:MAG: ribbon-helix-helix protein, CopG family [Terracidiphilus sp.]|jgi:ribbon-helix-helix CopG family protein
MDDKRTMTLNLTAREMEALEELAAKKEMSKTAILRHALRLYQLVDVKLAKGGKLFLEDDKNKKAELLVL